MFTSTTTIKKLVLAAVVLAALIVTVVVMNWLNTDAREGAKSSRDGLAEIRERVRADKAARERCRAASVETVGFEPTTCCLPGSRTTEPCSVP